MNTMDDLFEQNIKVPSGLASEVELMRFFTIFVVLKLVKNETIRVAFNTLINKLESRR